jgi:hypothetical protein
MNGQQSHNASMNGQQRQKASMNGFVKFIFTLVLVVINVVMKPFMICLFNMLTFLFDRRRNLILF